MEDAQRLELALPIALAAAVQDAADETFVAGLRALSKLLRKKRDAGVDKPRSKAGTKSRGVPPVVKRDVKLQKK